MKETLQDLKARRSVRAFQAKQVSDADLAAILEAGTFAPTGMGTQNPIMVAIRDPETLALVSKLNAAVMHSDKDPFYGAPCVVVVFADPDCFTYVEDGSLVMGNLLNAAHAVGVDSCWIHRARQVFETPEGKELMKKWGVPQRYQGIGNCILGYGEGPAPQAKERKADYVIYVG